MNAVAGVQPNGNYPCAHCTLYYDKKRSNSFHFNQLSSSTRVFRSVVGVSSTPKQKVQSKHIIKIQTRIPIITFDIFNFVPPPLQVFLGIGTHNHDYLLSEAGVNGTYDQFIEALHFHKIRKLAHAGHGLIGIEVVRLLSNREDICKAIYPEASEILAGWCQPRNTVHHGKKYQFTFNPRSAYENALKWLNIPWELSCLCTKSVDVTVNDLLQLQQLLNDYKTYRCHYPIVHLNHTVRAFFPKEHYLVHHFYQFIEKFRSISIF